MASLTDDELALVFSTLTHWSFGRVAQTCKQWHRIAARQELLGRFEAQIALTRFAFGLREPLSLATGCTGSYINCMTIDEDQGRLITCTDSDDLSVWQLSPDGGVQLLTTWRSAFRSIVGCEVCGDKLVLTGVGGGLVAHASDLYRTISPLKRPRLVQPLRLTCHSHFSCALNAPRQNMTGLAVRADLDRIFACCWAGGVHEFELSSGALLHTVYSMSCAYTLVVHERMIYVGGSLYAFEQDDAQSDSDDSDSNATRCCNDVDLGVVAVLYIRADGEAPMEWVDPANSTFGRYEYDLISPCESVRDEHALMEQLPPTAPKFGTTLHFASGRFVAALMMHDGFLYSGDGLPSVSMWAVQHHHGVPSFLHELPNPKLPDGMNDTRSFVTDLAVGNGLLFATYGGRIGNPACFSAWNLNVAPGAAPEHVLHVTTADSASLHACHVHNGCLFTGGSGHHKPGVLRVWKLS